MPCRQLETEILRVVERRGRLTLRECRENLKHVIDFAREFVICTCGAARVVRLCEHHQETQGWIVKDKEAHEYRDTDTHAHKHAFVNTELSSETCDLRDKRSHTDVHRVTHIRTDSHRHKQAQTCAGAKTQQDADTDRRIHTDTHTHTYYLRRWLEDQIRLPRVA